MKTSSRSRVDPFIVMDVLEAARRAEAAGRRIIHMEIGQPGTPAPAAARASLTEALKTEPMGYTVALGLPELRARIARLYADWYGLELDPGRVIVTNGSSGAFLLAFTAFLDAGQRVGLSEPGYPSYRQILRALSLEPVGLPTHAAHQHRLRAEDLPDRLDALIVASPSNPTGVMLGEAELGALASACGSRDIPLISDEIYHGLHYGARAVSALEVSDEAIVVNSFSKYFSMTGWRVGWMVVPEAHVRTIERLAQNMFICPPHAAQIAALAAFDGIEELEENRAVYAANRAALIEALPEMGLSAFAPPDGAFYVYADISHLTDDSRTFAARILDEAGVAVTPGLDFDPVRGHQTLRLSYCQSTEDVAEGIARLAAFFAR